MCVCGVMAWPNVCAASRIILILNAKLFGRQPLRIRHVSCNCVFHSHCNCNCCNCNCDSDCYCVAVAVTVAIVCALLLNLPVCWQIIKMHLNIQKAIKTDWQL